MRRRLLSLTLITGLALGSGLTAQEARVYGEGVAVTEVTPIAELLADPGAYIGRTVRVEGTVLDVCPRRGCWIEVGGDEATIQVKVDDGVIVFPTDAKGKPVAAQGTVEAVEMSREQYTAYLRHLAEERGEPFAAESVGPGPYRIIRIRGTGAEIG